MRLFHFIKGHKEENEDFIGLLDNQSYVFDNSEVKNVRLPCKSIKFDEAPKRRTRPEHHEDKIWNFLNSVSSNIEKSLKYNSDTLVLFNNKEYEHNTDDGFIGVTGTDANNFTLNTGNLIGFVKRNDYSLKISSRFGDAFLQYIIADADGFLEMDDLGGECYESGYEWLLAYLWNIKLKKAYRLGLPKTYLTRNARISRVRGTIDTIDYFQNINSGKYLCTYREHSYDNPATSLFIEAYATIKHRYSFCQQTRHVYNSFLTANQGLRRSRQEILRTPYFTNPFYSDYNVLIDLSKQIIRRNGSDFDSQNDSSAFLFDISMLFEYFIRKLFKRAGIRLLGKFEHLNKIPTGALGNYMRKLEPDLVFEAAHGLYVFDVKYKYFDDRFGVKREDLFQLHTYIGQVGNTDLVVRGCGFIYPISETRWDTLKMGDKKGFIRDDIIQQGKAIPFYVLFLKIPNGSRDFNKKMKKSCNDFSSTIFSQVLKYN